MVKDNCISRVIILTFPSLFFDFIDYLTIDYRFDYDTFEKEEKLHQ